MCLRSITQNLYCKLLLLNNWNVLNDPLFPLAFLIVSYANLYLIFLNLNYSSHFCSIITGFHWRNALIYVITWFFRRQATPSVSQSPGPDQCHLKNLSSSNPVKLKPTTRSSNDIPNVWEEQGLALRGVKLEAPITTMLEVRQPRLSETWLKGLPPTTSQEIRKTWKSSWGRSASRSAEGPLRRLMDPKLRPWRFVSLLVIRSNWSKFYQWDSFIPSNDFNFSRTVDWNASGRFSCRYCS